MTQDDVRALIDERAEAPDLSHGYWLNDPDGDYAPEGEYCGKCVRALPALPGLVVCHLLYLLGELPDTDHEWKEVDDYGYQGCHHCSEWRRKAKTHRWPGRDASARCLTIPARIMSRLDGVVDGGWAIEHDSLVTCDGCGVDLHVIPTDYCAEQELDHWEEFGPPADGYQWWQLSEVLDSCDEAAWARLLAMVAKWGVQ